MNVCNFYYERKLWQKNIKFIAGLDEVGRGSFAGPIVTSAVMFTPIFNSQVTINSLKQIGIRINDSKKLTARQREVADKWIKDNALTWGVGEASVAEINRLGMVKATYSAFRRAVAKANIKLHTRVEFLLIDAFYIPYLRGFPVDRKKEIIGRKIREVKKIKKSRTKKLKDLKTKKNSKKVRAEDVFRSNLGSWR